MTGEALREPTGEKIKDSLTPENHKSVNTKLREATDNAASYIPGQEKTRDFFSDDAKTPHLTHDAGRAGGASAFKPDSEKTLGDSVKATFDQIGSVQPKENKSTVQEIRDTITPGNHSTTEEQGKGVIAQAGDAIVGAKDAVVNALTGGPAAGQGGAGTATH